MPEGSTLRGRKDKNVNVGELRDLLEDPERGHIETTYVLDHAITVGEEYGWPPITSVVIIDAEVAR